MAAKLELGDGQVLYAGVNGRRALAKGDEPLVEAPTLGLESIVGILRDDQGQFVFVAKDGDAFLSKEPLGPLDVTRPGPFEGEAKLTNAPSFRQVAVGKGAILGVTVEGTLWRSADFGKTWAQRDYQGANKGVGQATSVAIDSKGHGLLVHLPQKLFVTHDDGATWKPIPSLGFAVEQAHVDGTGRVYLAGQNGEWATLDGDALKNATDAPAPMLKPKKAAPPPKSGEESTTRWVLSGDHVIDFTTVLHKGAASEVRVASRMLGAAVPENEPPASAVDLLSSKITKQGAIAAFGSTILYAKEDDSDDQAIDGPVTTLVRSDDFGATWHKDATIAGTLGGATAEGADVKIAVGPKGWAYTNKPCAKPVKPKAGSSSNTSPGSECGHRQVRLAGAKDFEDLLAVEEFAPRAFAFDEARERVYAVGDYQGHRYVYESPLGQNKFTRTKVLDVPTGVAVTITVDPTGTLRILRRNSSPGHAGWVLSRRDAEGKELPAIYLDLDSSGAVALVGLHGLLISSHKSWESADGGETWVRVPSNGYDSGVLRCSEAGCKMASTVRVGWDLPAYHGEEKVAGAGEPIKVNKPAASKPVVATRPALTHAPLELACKSAGPASTLPYIPRSYDAFAPDVRWMALSGHEDGRSSIFVGSKTSSRELQMLGAEIKQNAPAKPGAAASSVTHRQGAMIVPGGAISVRYSYESATVAGKYNPVDVEIAWWSSKTGKVVHHKLAKLKPFRVSRYGISGAAHIVDGGLVFRGANDDVVHFIHDDGKDELLSSPGEMQVAGALHSGSRWILNDISYNAARFAFSDDGKSWTTKGWTLDDSGGSSFGFSQGKPFVVNDRSYDASRGGPLLFSLDGSLGNDPPTPIELPLPTTLDARCDSQDSLLGYGEEDLAEVTWLSATIDEGDKTVTTFNEQARMRHFGAKGGECTSAFHLEKTAGSSKKHAANGEQRVFLFPEEKGWSGWRFSDVPDPRHKGETMVHAEPLACVAPGETPAKK